MGHLIVQRIRENPSLMEIPRWNLDRWMQQEEREFGCSDPYYQLWKEILEKMPLEDILHILESDDPSFEQLQHGSPFVGLPSPAPVIAIFNPPL